MTEEQKERRREYQREYRQRPEAKARAKARLQRPEIRAQRAAWERQRYHRPDVKEQAHRYQAERRADPEYREYHREYHRQYREDNAERLAEYNREYGQAHRQTPEGRAKMATRTHKRRASLREAEGSFTAEEFTALGSACAYCGIECDPEIDHDIPLSRGGTNWIKNIVPACMSCNRSKRDMTGNEFRASNRLQRRLSGTNR